MAPQKTKVPIAGVAEGKVLVGVPTGDDVSAEERVQALFQGSMSEEIFQVRIVLLPFFSISASFILIASIFPLISGDVLFNTSWNITNLGEHIGYELAFITHCVTNLYSTSLFLSLKLGTNIPQGWGSSLIRDSLVLVSASSTPHGTTTFHYTVQPSHCNRLGNLHGGCISTIFDFCTTSALCPIAKPGFWAFAGVSRTLNVTYIRPAPVGERVLVVSEVVHAGKRLCSLKGVMKRESDGAVMAVCEHGKVSIDPPVEKL
jgi:acyl-coenzyme A thioesterase 13